MGGEPELSCRWSLLLRKLHIDLRAAFFPFLRLRGESHLVSCPFGKVVFTGMKAFIYDRAGAGREGRRRLRVVGRRPTCGRTMR
eukprot:scaffold99480_cov28-Tisochrysis_lutea.AAC.1